MDLSIFGTNLKLTDAIRSYLLDRLDAATRRFSRQVQWVVVRLEDVNGPRREQDKVCRLHLNLRPSEDLIVEEADSDLYAAIDQAANRVKRILGRRANRLPRQRVTRTRRGLRALAGRPVLAGTARVKR